MNARVHDDDTPSVQPDDPRRMHEMAAAALPSRIVTVDDKEKRELPEKQCPFLHLIEKKKRTP